MSAHNFQTWTTLDEKQKSTNKRAVDAAEGPYAPPPVNEEPLMYLPGADDPFDPDECKNKAMAMMAKFRGAPLAPGEGPKLKDVRAVLAGADKKTEDYMDMDVGAAPAAPAPPINREAASRKRGLETPLDASNKGFEMLQKMGYEGGGLGKDEDGMVDPLPTEIRKTRDARGIGIPEAARRAQASWEAAKRHMRKVEASSFAQHNQRRFNERAGLKASRRARSAVRDLDERAGLRWTPIWPSDEAHPQRAFADASGAVYGQDASGLVPAVGGLDEEPPEVALRTAVAYLRDCHGYCLVHGCQLADDSPDLEAELAELVEDAED